MGGPEFPVPTRHQRLLVVAMQAAIVAIFVAGAAAGNASVALNAALALAVTFLPALLARDWDLRLGVGTTLWITTAVLLHALGMLGLYVVVPWWDNLTHTLSAVVVAAVGYATARAFDRYSDAVAFPPRFVFVYVLLFTMAFGVLWEVLEFATRLLTDALGMEAVLIQYGLRDTILDLVFDLVGAVLVALFGTRRLSAAVESIHAWLDGARTGDSSESGDE
ncbi:hypothetical protein [Halegenticoccus tardaugens]|uniref:hypothetical protein n=1 Tax=Halegenticoccus tardaugens TaxID=2071624 RepID=UPI00100AA84F|nr:hypothetical protein [Halegenticoccus tardaugens]